MHERSVLSVSGAQVLVAAKHPDENGLKHPILVRARIGRGTLYVLTPWLKEGDQALRKVSYLAMLGGVADAENYDLQRWAYFNWLLYYMGRNAAGAPAADYGVWPSAPVPNHHDVRVLATIFLTTFGLLLAAFIPARIYSNRHPEALHHFYLTPSAAPASLGAAAVAQAPSAQAQSAAHGDPRWEKIGFHRPLSGFLYNYLLAIFIVIPLNIGVTFYLERNFVNPFLEARGAWAAVTMFMLFFFTLLDVGTSQAMVKYFAEFRVREPSRAVTYAQFFVWFHALAGIFQITALGLFSAVFLPHTQAAFLTWFIVLHSLIQFPGFISIFFNLFRALQRFDYSQFLIVLTFAMGPVLQMLFAIYMRRWGLAHPVYGEGLGVVFGFAIGGFVNNLLMGIFCAFFYRAVGFKLTTIFMAHFDWDTIKRSLLYGVKLTVGQAVAALSWGVVPILMLVMLDNFLELNEIFVLTFVLTYSYLETGAYIFTTLMPSISESFSHGKIALTRRYLDQGLRWGIMGCAMLGVAFVAFSDVFVRGLLPAQFARAVAVMGLAHLWRAIDFWTRLPDQVFQGVGRTGLFTWTALIEHLARIILSFYFIRAYGFVGVFYAFIIS